MELAKLSLESIRRERVAILGYGNQGRAHALNLRDSGVSVAVGARPEGKGAQLAKADGFSVTDFAGACKGASVVMFLLPDQIIGEVYLEVSKHLNSKFAGFAHGFSYTYGLFEKDPEVRYFLAGPKGAGAILRETFQRGDTLPGVYAVGDADPKTEAMATSYAKAIGIGGRYLLKTTFQEETECDLFGEQAVLCGGIFELMEKSFEVLVRNGHSPEMAFLETCFESKLILELWMKYGPKGVREKISPTAFYGGLTQGKRVLGQEFEGRLETVFSEIHTGQFAKEWMEEVQKGTPKLKKWMQENQDLKLEETYQKLRSALLAPGDSNQNQ